MPVPRVSILLPTYEPNPEFLKAALDSLLGQTFQDWTLLIHDDASTADVRSFVEPYLKDPRITFARSRARLGIASNWNACLAKANQPYVQFLFQDDRWKPEYLQSAVKALEEHPTAGLAAVNHRYLKSPPPPREEGDGGRGQDIYDEVTAARAKIQPGLHKGINFLRSWSKNGLRPNVVGEPSFVMLRKSVVDRIGLFNGSMKQGLDVEYWVRTLAISDLVWIPEELGDFRVHAKAASSVHHHAGTGLADRLRCFETLLQALPNERSWIRRDMRLALSDMVRKWKERKANGGGTGGIDKRWLFFFTFKHPLLCSMAWLQVKRYKLRVLRQNL